MPTPSEIRNTLKDRMDKINVSQSDLSRITGISNPTLSNFVCNRFEPPLQTLQNLHKTLSGMERLAATLAPVPVDFRNAPVVRDLVSKINRGALDIRIIDTSVSPAFTHHAVGGLSALAGSGVSTSVEGQDISDLAEKVSEILNRGKKSETYRTLQEA